MYTDLIYQIFRNNEIEKENEIERFKKLKEGKGLDFWLWEAWTREMNFPCMHNIQIRGCNSMQSGLPCCEWIWMSCDQLEEKELLVPVLDLIWLWLHFFQVHDWLWYLETKSFEILHTSIAHAHPELYYQESSDCWWVARAVQQKVYTI